MSTHRTPKPGESTYRYAKMLEEAVEEMERLSEEPREGKSWEALYQLAVQGLRLEDRIAVLKANMQRAKRS